MTNTPSPLVPQGSLPARGKSVYFKVLMVASIHVVVIGGMLMLGCKDTTKEKTDTSSTSSPDTSTPTNAPDATMPVANPSNALNSVPQPTPASNTQYAAPPVPIPQSAPQPPITPPVSDTHEYVVVHGDTLAAIAHKNGISLKAMLEANPGVNPKKLHVGQKLQLPGSTGVAPAPMAGADVSAEGDEAVYTVKSGDSLTRIAHSHHTSVKKILALNDLKTSSIKAGQKLKLPAPHVAGADTASAPPSALTAQPAAAPMSPPVYNSNSGPAAPGAVPTNQ